MWCPFCARSCDRTEDLVDHLIHEHCGHLRSPRVGGRLFYPSSYGRQGLVCWCGAEFETYKHPASNVWFSGRRAFEEHLEARGGLEAHLVEIALGICDNGD